MNVIYDAYDALVQRGLDPQTAGYLLLASALIFIFALIWRPYIRLAEAFLKNQRRREEKERLLNEEQNRTRRDAERAKRLREQLVEREQLERERAEITASLAIIEAEGERLAQEAAFAASEYQRIQQRLDDTRPEYERALQMGHEVLAIRARDAEILAAGGKPPKFRVTQVTQAVNQQLYDHRRSGKPITMPAYIEYANHPCMRVVGK